MAKMQKQNLNSKCTGKFCYESVVLGGDVGKRVIEINHMILVKDEFSFLMGLLMVDRKPCFTRMIMPIRYIY